MIRYVTKNIVVSGIRRECEVQIAYAIGVAEPVSLYVDTFGTGRVQEQCIETAARVLFDLTPGLSSPPSPSRGPYTATRPPMGTLDAQFPWEQTDRADAILQAVA